MTGRDDQIRALEDQAAEADRQERVRHAAFLYEQARRLAREDGQDARAFTDGLLAARSWRYGGEDAQMLTVLLELLGDIPGSVDPWDVHDTKMLYLWYLMDGKDDTSLDELADRTAELDDLCASLGQPDSRDIPYRAAELLFEQGRWAECLTQYEIAWSRPDGHGVYQGASAAGAARTALRLGVRAEAERWLPHVIADYWIDNARIYADFLRLDMTLFDNDGPGAQHALLDLDDSMLGIERPSVHAAITPSAVVALALDQRFGDPMAESHPISRRLTDFPRAALASPHIAYTWHQARLLRHLAGMRFAAGIEPVDDLFYRKPHDLSAGRRADASRRAPPALDTADEAMAAAIRLDTMYRCTWRQEEVASLRDRIDQIASG